MELINKALCEGGFTLDQNQLSSLKKHTSASSMNGLNDVIIGVVVITD